MDNVNTNFQQLYFIPTRVNSNGTGLNSGYSTVGQTYTSASAELNVVVMGSISYLEAPQT